MHFSEFFVGTKRRFELQVQGKFKHIPTGDIYVGADITTKMELGIITGSVCRMLLKFIQGIVSDLHYSFGDHQSDPNYEVLKLHRTSTGNPFIHVFPLILSFFYVQSAHLVAPLMKALDRVVVTPAGQGVPPIGPY